MVFNNKIMSIFGLRKHSSAGLHHKIMSGALNQALFLEHVIPDTFQGRFQMVTVHAALTMRHLRRLGASGRVLSQELYEDIFSGFDYALREDGVGDAKIARKIRGLGEEFYGLARALEVALDSPDRRANTMLLLARNGVCATQHESKVADYLIQADTALSESSDLAVQDGEFSWPEFPPVSG